MDNLRGRFTAVMLLGLAAVACGSESDDGDTWVNPNTATAGSAGSGGSGGSGGRGLDYGYRVEGVTSAEGCVPMGGGFGGADGVSCEVITIQLSRPIAASNLSFTIRTSSGDTFGQGGGTNSPVSVWTSGDPVGSLGLGEGSESTYAPTFVDVEVFERGVPVGSGRFDQLDYYCYTKTADDWCWQAEPVTLTIGDNQ